jgi:hypothetical protein
MLPRIERKYHLFVTYLFAIGSRPTFHLACLYWRQHHTWAWSGPGAMTCIRSPVAWCVTITTTRRNTMLSKSKVAAMAVGLGLALSSAGFAQTSSSTTTTEKPDGQKNSSTTATDPAKGQTSSTNTASNPSTGQSSSSSTTQQNDGTKTTTKTDKN